MRCPAELPHRAQVKAARMQGRRANICIAVIWRPALVNGLDHARHSPSTHLPGSSSGTSENTL